MPAAQTSPTFWQRTRTNSKAGFDKIYGLVDKLGAPVNRLSNKLGSEAFWPTTLDKESDKAARILKSFCKDGFYAEETKQPEDGPKSKQKVLKKIPAEVIKNAKGLAIFTTMRTGLWVSGAGGSGILVGRLPDGSWSPPSGIMLHTAGLGFLVGVDIYDCVVVINTDAALEAFSKIRCTLGGEISAVAGPVGVGGVLESEVHKRQAAIFTYLKSRGFYAGVQVDGTIVIERSDENERFYGERLSVAEILAGKVRHPPLELKTLMNTLKAAQGDRVDSSLLPTEAAPGDFDLTDSPNSFGIPDPEDDDPYGVRALEQAGFHIKEAGSQQPVDSTEFEFNPAPTSPVWRTSFSVRRSIDARSMSGLSHRSSWRMSQLSTEQRPSMSEMGTQTDFDDVPPSPRLLHSPKRSPGMTLPNGHQMADIPEDKSTDDVASIHDKHDAETQDDADVEDEADDVAVIHEVHRAESVHQVPAAQVITRARLVEVPKRGPPPQLPPRNPIRNRGKPLIIGAADESPKSPSSTFPRRQSGGSSPGSARTRSASVSSVESVELNSQLTNGFGKKAQTTEVKPEEEEKKTEEKKEIEEEIIPAPKPTEVVVADTQTQTMSPPSISPVPVVPGAFA